MAIQKLLRISDLNLSQIENLMQRALDLRLQIEKNPNEDIFVKSLRQSPVGLIFLEPSTRTRVSFERACHLTQRKTVLLSGKDTSFEKGESLSDAVMNLKALGVYDFIIRTYDTGGLEILRGMSDIGVINGGDGVGEHPTQALLDCLTILRFCVSGKSKDLKNLKGFRLGLVGDLRRSRVAQSWSALAEVLGIEIELFSPPAWAPQNWGSKWKHRAELSPSMKDLNALMVFRVQTERTPDSTQHHVTLDELNAVQVSLKSLKDDQFVLHPGPVNWGVELREDVREDKRTLILEQVKSGLALRSVLISELGA